jgi:regulator of protease activity HflC (stomatin/prohibitin superfamily)
MKELSLKKITLIALSVVALIVLISYSGKMFEEVEAGEIVVIQHPLSGELDIITTPGTYSQYLGKATHYKRRTQIWFSNKTDQGTGVDESIKVRFNDGGHAQISGSASMELPLDSKAIKALHSNFGSQEAIEHELVKTVLQKAVFMSGPLMSSKESYAEKRNELINYIEDQASHGVYKTIQRDDKTIDVFTNAEKVITVVEIQKDPKGGFARVEKSPLQRYGVTLSNLSINGVDYDKAVENQIKQQQQLVMQVQTAIANAKKSEQDALTSEQKGKADAAAAKWAQEVIKAKLVTEAQQRKEVAVLEAQAAELEAKKTRIDADAEAYKNSKLVSAGLSPIDRAEYEMKTKIEVAKALSGITLPSTYMAGQGGNGKESMLEAILGANLLQQFSTSPKK